jgi:O-succinylbenzoic acid--CoA ligase
MNANSFLKMHDWLSMQATARPDGVALVVNEQQWTYAQLHQQVEKLSASLLFAGVRAGEKVAVWLPNGAAYVLLIHALMRIGAVLVPLNARLTVRELRYQIEQTDCRWIVARDPQALSGEGATTLAVDDLVSDRSRDAELPPSTMTFDTLQAIVFTSGTSGQPKGAMLTVGNQFYGAMASAYRIGTLPQDRWLCCLPLYHVGGLAIVLRCCLYGTTVVLHDGFDLDAIEHTLETQPITLISLVPTMLYRLLNVTQAAHALQRVRLVLLGGSAAAPDLIVRCEELNIPVAPTFGLTEACSQVATMLPEDVRHKAGSVGKPLPFTNIRVVNEQDKSLPAGEYGEVVVSGPTVMMGYYQQPDVTQRVLRGGELFTGDIGYLDADGDLWLVTRRSDLIVSGGENVYPAEVEQVLLQHPAVAAACVVGVPSVEWGQQVAAAVVLRDGVAMTTESLLAFSRERLAGYKQPRIVRFVEALPQTASGKIQRQAVIDLFKQDAQS